MSRSTGFLVADIGGTHARFAFAPDDWPHARHFALRTANAETAQDSIDAALEALDIGPSDLTGACFAVAGPVEASVAPGEAQATLTNGSLTFATNALRDRLGCTVQLLNDFEAIAVAVPFLSQVACLVPPSEAPAGSATPQPASGRLCIGPGTGLGVSLALPSAGHWLAIPSEGAHAGIAPGNPLEQEICNLLGARHDRVSWETAVSGPGLVRLHTVVCDLWGMPAEPLTAPEIVSRGVDMSDPACHQTLELFSGLLGSFAGAMALAFGARGGVVLVGDMALSLRDYLADSPLRRRFDEQGDLPGFTERLPIDIALDPMPGLHGAYLRASRTGVATS